MFNSADFHVGAYMVMKRWRGRPPRARHTTPMISLDRLVCRAYAAQALKRRSVKIHRSQPACRQHQPATEVQHEDHRKALHRKVLQKTPVLAMHQSCVRTELSAVIYDLNTTITAFKSWIPSRVCLRFKYSSTPVSRDDSARKAWH